MSALSGSGVNPTISNPNNVPGFAQFAFYPAAGPNTNLSFAAIPRGTGATNNHAQIAVFKTDVIADPNNYEFAGFRARDTDFVLGSGKSGTGQNRPFMLTAGFLSDNLTNNGQLFLDTNGNVGIGTTTPGDGAKLDVAGNINTSTYYNIGGNRVLSVSGSAAGPDFLNSNTFAGVGVGTSTTPGSPYYYSGHQNSFFGNFAGFSNTSGNANSFFGWSAGTKNTVGYLNAFFGANAGQSNTNGCCNSFFGTEAGKSNTLGAGNAFFGTNAGDTNIDGTLNTVIGELADVGSTSLTNATAIGNSARVDQSNSLVLGSINEVNGGTADTNVGIGTTAPARKLHLTGVGSDNAGQTDLLISGTGGAGSGVTLQAAGVGGRTYSLLSTANAAGGLGTGGGRLAVFDVTGSAYRMVLDSGGNVGIGTFDPDSRLSVNGSASKPGGGSWNIFSDERLKIIKGRFTHGLKALMQLQPVRYEYKPDNALGLTSSGEHIGFGAQAVEKIIPEAVSKNARGYLLVNNDPIMWTMLNAIKEQQQTIEKLQQENHKLKARHSDTETRLATIETTVKQIRQDNRRPRRRK